MNKTFRNIITVIIVLVILFIIALPKLEFLKAEKQTENTPVTSENVKIPVSAVVAVPSKLDNKIQVTGEIRANESLELRPEVSGKVTSISFKEGEWVKKGALLVTINDEELRAQLEKLRYSKQLNEDMEYRQRMLLEKEAISQEEYDQALTQLNTITADIKVLEAQIAKSQIRAPFNGVIGLRYVSEGSYITPQTVVASFFSLDPAKIEFSIPSKYSNDVKVGQEIMFTTDALNQEFNGTIYAIEPQIDPATRTLTLRALSSNKDQKLLPGQFVRVNLILQRDEEAILLPTQAVIPELEGHKVFVNNQGIVEERRVQIGIRTAEQVEIEEGINMQDTVITSGILQLKQGSEVEITSLN